MINVLGGSLPKVSNYGIMRKLLSRYFWEQKGGDAVEAVTSFLVAVVAGVVCHLICKWLDNNER